MTRRQFIIQAFADYYGIELTGNEQNDLTGFDFEMKTKINDFWDFSLKEAVYCVESLLDKMGDNLSEETISNYVCRNLYAGARFSFQNSPEFHTGRPLNGKWLSIETVLDCINTRIIPEKQSMQSLPDRTICIDNVNLIKAWEYEQYRNLIPLIKEEWWTSTPYGSSGHEVAIINAGGVGYLSNSDDDYSRMLVRMNPHTTLCNFAPTYYEKAIRPVLRLSGTIDYRPGETFFLAEQEWVVLSNNMAICKNSICVDQFAGFVDFDRDGMNDYEQSRVKHILDGFAQKYHLSGEVEVRREPESKTLSVAYMEPTLDEPELDR